MSKDKDKKKGSLVEIHLDEKGRRVTTETRMINESEVPKGLLTLAQLEANLKEIRRIAQEMVDRRAEAKHQRLVASRQHIKRIK